MRLKRRIVARVAITLVGAVFAATCARHAPNKATFPALHARGVSGDGRFVFRRFDVPGASRTIASGINDTSDIVGLYEDSLGTHAFLLRAAQFTTFDFHGAEFTAALGIGTHGEIVGAYRMPDEPAAIFHGYLRTPDGRFEHVDARPHKSTIAQRILPDGTILGCRHGDDFGPSMKGAVLSPSKYSETDAPASMHNGATPDLRRIVGLYKYASGDRSSAYVIDDGRWQQLVVPGSTATTAWDVNPSGVIAGTYRDSTTSHGFVLTSEGFVTVDVPNTAATRVLGINTLGAVVGSFDVGGRTSAFVATPAQNSR